jgi:imidazolonepropionase-like amidohydrolase
MSHQVNRSVRPGPSLARRQAPRSALAALLSLATLSASAVAPQPPRGAEATTAFVGARAIDPGSGQVVDRAVLVVDEGRISAFGPADAVAVPAGAARVDLAGRVVVPGLVNAHGHVGETRGLESGPHHYTRDNVLAQLRQYARYGVTTVASLGGDGPAGAAVRREQRRAGPLDRARLLIAGPVIAAGTPEEARKQVAAAAALEPDFIKIRVDDNLGTAQKMPPEVYQAVIDEAHRRGLRVAAHIFYLEDAKAVVKAGADLLAHSVRDRDVDAELVALLKERGVCVSPTLVREVSTFIYASEPDFFADPFFTRWADPGVLAALRDPARQAAVRSSREAREYRKALEVAGRNLKVLAEAGVGLAFGTDSGPPARFQGYFEHLEAELMVKAGLSPAQVLRAATAGAAHCLGLAGRVGTLQPGAWADFLVLETSPEGDVRGLRAIDSVWIGGGRAASW